MSCPPCGPTRELPLTGAGHGSSVQSSEFGSQASHQSSVPGEGDTLQQKLKKRRTPTGPLRPRSPATLPFHLLFPLTIPFLSCHGSSTVRGEHSCRDSRPLGEHTPHPQGLIHSIPGTACPGPCGNSKPPLPAPNPAGKGRSCHQAHTTR